MFEHELQEKTCAHIHVTDVPTPTMYTLLFYLYMGKGLPSSSRPFMGEKDLHGSIYFKSWILCVWCSNGDEDFGVMDVAWRGR
jgi:hypothetical protein